MSTQDTDEKASATPTTPTTPTTPVLCNGNGGTSPSDHLDNGNNNADSRDDSSEGYEAVEGLETTDYFNIPASGESSGLGKAETICDVKHEQEMATVSHGGLDCVEGNNRPFDVHSQASSGKWLNVLV